MPGKRHGRKMKERRVFMAHAAGLTDREIAYYEKTGPKAVRRILGRAGVDVEEVVAKRKEAEDE